MSKPYKIDSNEKKMILELSEKITGNYPLQGNWQNLLFTNIIKRMRICKIDTVEKYLVHAQKDKNELSILVSSLTIHSTSWFREKIQLDLFSKYVDKSFTSGKISKLKILCAACSTGEEVYSIGLILEKYRKTNLKFDYEIFGIDIDPISIAKGLNGVYLQSSIKEIPSQYQEYVLKGSDHSSGLFTLDSEIRKRCLFATKNISKDNFINEKNFDYIFCRNVLIYFSSYEIEKIINRFLNYLNENGSICLGQSEAISASKYFLIDKDCAIYSQQKKKHFSSAAKKKVLIIDDSKTVLAKLESILTKCGFNTHLASSANEASAFLQKNKVDIISLDLNMPEIGGAEWLKKQRHMGLTTPVIIISESSKFQALDLLNILEVGGNDFIEKRHLGDDILVIERKFKQLVDEHKEIKNEFSNIDYNQYITPVEAIVIGASTGGTQALVELLKDIPKPCPPIAIVQHLPENFNKIFSKRISEISGLIQGTPSNKQKLEKNHIYLSHGDYHIGISFECGLLKLTTSTEPLIEHHRPSVEYLFRSAIHPNKKVLAILLTGMGKDGASGLLKLKNIGNMTIAQNRESSIVFGMPGEACKIGAARFISDLKGIRNIIDQAIAKSN